MRDIKNAVIESSFNKLSVHIGGSGHAYCDPSWYQDKILIPFSRIYYVLNGEATMRYDDKTIVMKPGFLYLVPFNFSFVGECASSLEKIYFHLTLSYFGRIDLFDNCTDILSLPCDHANKVAELYDSNKVSDILMLKNILNNDILSLIHHAGMDAELFVYSDIIRKALSFIDRNISSHLKVSDVSSHLFVSESTLSKQFRTELGVSMGKYISNKLLAETQTALLNKKLSIPQICEKFGFCDRSYFARFFKKKTGKTPTQFKREYGKNSQ